jgi:hypothetical protein
MTEPTNTQESTSVQEEPKARVAHLFMSLAPSIKYVFKDGIVANFVAYRFFTENPEYIAELQREIKLGHPSFYINPKEVVVNPAEQDPLSRFRKQVIEEFLISLAEKTDPDRDMGIVEAQTLTPASTTSIASVAAGGDASNIKARIADLMRTKGLSK